MYAKIKAFVYNNNQNKLTFSQLVPSQEKEDKVFTLIPLLHLTTQRKIDLDQEEHFGEINIILNTKKEVDEELKAES